jgi:Protein of unknown function DUF86
MTTPSGCATCSTMLARRSRWSVAVRAKISTWIACCSSRSLISSRSWARPRVVGSVPLPGDPWHDAVGARNRIVHGYYRVDYDIVWRIVTVEFPLLIAVLERALPGHVG